MKKLLTILAISTLAHLHISTLISAQVGKQFPAITGKTLEDMAITIPSDTKGKFTLIAMAYSKKSDEELQTWFEPVHYKFIAKAGMFDKDYDVNIYFIPMFTGVKKMSAAIAKKKAKTRVNKKLHPYMLFYKGELQKYKELLGIEKKDTPYFFVLDKEGKIIYVTSGKYTDDKMEEVEGLLN